MSLFLLAFCVSMILTTGCLQLTQNPDEYFDPVILFLCSLLASADLDHTPSSHVLLSNPCNFLEKRP